MRYPWNWKASYLGMLFASLIMILVVASCIHAAYGQVPQQAQASNLAVPEPPHLLTPHKSYPFVSGIIVTQCKVAVAVILIDRGGHYHIQRFKDLSYRQLLDKISDAVYPDQILEVTVRCPDEKSV